MWDKTKKSLWWAFLFSLLTMSAFSWMVFAHVATGVLPFLSTLALLSPAPMAVFALILTFTALMLIADELESWFKPRDISFAEMKNNLVESHEQWVEGLPKDKVILAYKSSHTVKRSPSIYRARLIQQVNKGGVLPSVDEGGVAEDDSPRA